MGPATVGALSRAECMAEIAAGRLAFRTGPLLVRVRSRIPAVASYIHEAYGANPLALEPAFSDLHVELITPGNLRRVLRPQARFLIDGQEPFEPLPLSQAPALLEWGLNWAIASSCHQWLMLHAAALERGGQALILPAPPGSGKSTLCAALALRGWRLLTDEIVLIDPGTLEIVPLARPVNLKNAAIELMGAFEPSARWGPVFKDTSKGRVAHLLSPPQSVQRMAERARPRWIVFPRWVPGAAPLLSPRPRVQAFASVVGNAFNYSILEELGFRTMAGLLEACDCHDFAYSQLTDALEVFDWLVEEGGTTGHGKQEPPHRPPSRAHAFAA